jgi:hypothetical protein
MLTDTYPPQGRFNYLKIPLPSSQEPVKDACQTFTIFHVITIPVYAKHRTALPSLGEALGRGPLPK